MGKYSLDAFEVHPLVKLRPAVKPAEMSSYRLLELKRLELEPETGVLLTPPPVGEGQVILHLNLGDTNDVSDACGFVRRMGFCYDGGKGLAGVLVKPGACSETGLDQLIQAYRQGFEGTFLLVEPGTAPAKAFDRAGVGYGLWLDLSRGILPLRRSIGQENLSRNWEKYPVYLWAGQDLNEQQLDAARRWHASGADVPAVLGPRMTLRRMMFPGELTAGGVMPLRLWWQNVGTAPCYRDVEICLELRKDGNRCAIALPGDTMQPGLGDTTFNTTGRLPKEMGTYELCCGLRCEKAMLPLAMDGAGEDGMYRLGTVTLDGIPRPYLATMWEETYADGYYPLEDPAQPE